VDVKAKAFIEGDTVSWRFTAETLRSNILQGKVQPVGTTFAAKLKVPMRERSSCLVHWYHLLRDDLISCRLSAGRRASSANKLRRTLG